MRKFTEAQAEVIKLMRQHWQLGVSLDMSGRKWIQKDGIGRGGETKKVTSSTFNAINDAGLLECVDNDFPTKKYILNELGKTCEIQIKK